MANQRSQYCDGSQVQCGLTDKLEWWVLAAELTHFPPISSENAWSEGRACWALAAGSLGCEFKRQLEGQSRDLSLKRCYKPFHLRKHQTSGRTLPCFQFPIPLANFNYISSGVGQEGCMLQALSPCNWPPSSLNQKTMPRNATI